MEYLPSFNLPLFKAIYDLSGHVVIADWIGIFLADYFQYVIALLFIVLFFYKGNNEVRNRAMVVMATVSALVARLIIKPIILIFSSEPRPFVMLHFNPLISTVASENFQSFPSGHALFFFAIAMIAYLFDKKWGLFLFVSAVLISLARIYVGVHWPLDIVSGALIGMIVGWVFHVVYLKKKESINQLVSLTFLKKAKL